jgi:predicted  nucleic acid-binding Zn-ribbon protein
VPVDDSPPEVQVSYPPKSALGPELHCKIKTMKELMRNLFELQTLEFHETVQPDTETRRTALRAKIPPPILDHYDRLRARGKKGVATLNHRTCSGCHMRVPVGVVMNLRHGADVELCDNCGRYLYLREDAVTPGEAAPKIIAAPEGRKTLAHV